MTSRAGVLRLGLALLLLAPAVEAAAPLPAHPPAALRQDLEFLLRTLEEVHPDPYRAVSREDLEAHARRIAAGLTEPLTALRFFPRVAPLITSLGDGHTLISPTVDSAALEEAGLRLFPLDLLFTPSGAFVLRSSGPEGEVPPGARLLSVNGTAIEEITESLLSLASGETRDLRLAKLGVHDTFKLFLWQIYGFAGTFDIEHEHDGERASVRLAGLLPSQIRSRRPKETAARPFSFEALEDGIGLLRVRHFELDSADFRRFLRSTFKTLRSSGTRHLVIDVRGNVGGNAGNGDELLRYLADRPFRQIEAVEVKVSRQLEEAVKRVRIPAVVRWLPVHLLSSQGRKFGKAEKGSVIRLDEDPVQPHPEKDRFQGKVYVLTDALTFSAGAIFAATVKRYGLGTLVGRETGGQASWTFGQPLGFTLPGSGLGLTVSAMRMIGFGPDPPAVPPRGIAPDHPVPLSVEGVLGEVDADLERVRELISAARDLAVHEPETGRLPLAAGSAPPGATRP